MSKIFIITQTLSCSFTLLYGAFMFFWSTIVNHSYDSTIWSILLALSSGSIVHVNTLILRDKLNDWYAEKSLKTFMIFGALLTAVTAIASIFYVILAIHGGERFDLQSYYSAATLALMSMKGSLSLVFTSRKHMKQLQGNSS